MATTATPTLPDTLRLGAVHLTVADLDRSIAFYQGALGLRVRDRDGDARATLGTETDDLVVLVQELGARRAGRHAGLYHYALLFPSRAELARALQRLAVTRTPIQGASDHGVSEAIYLADPDGNGIELYADRPRDAWPAPEVPGHRIGMYTIALDVHALLDVVAGEEVQGHAGAGLVLGHMHLHVGDVAQAEAFYAGVLGFDVMVTMPSASFLAAGGYHHHLGVNTWRGEGVGPAPAGTAGVRLWEIVLDSAEQVAAARARLEGAGVATAEHPGGFAARDPWETPFAVIGR